MMYQSYVGTWPLSCENLKLDELPADCGSVHDWSIVLQRRARAGEQPRQCMGEWTLQIECCIILGQCFKDHQSNYSLKSMRLWPRTLNIVYLKSYMFSLSRYNHGEDDTG